MAIYSDEEEVEYLIPAPVLTSADKLFNFGFIAFSLVQMAELLAVIGFVYLTWRVLSFVPWQVLLAFSVLIVAMAVLFITQPINGLPGDTWIKYTFRYYVLERSRHLLRRRKDNSIRVTSFRLVANDGRVVLELGSPEVSGNG